MPTLMPIERRTRGRAVVAIESTVFVHGLPREEAIPLAQRLIDDAQQAGVSLAIVGVLAGRAVVGLTADELSTLITERAPKLNTANLGLALHNTTHGATTVSTTVELAARAGLRLVATGGLGGVHKGLATRIDISADLAAMARWPVAVVCSGVKTVLDVASTREALETLGVPVIGVGTDRFPGFMVRSTELPVDGRFDAPGDLARYIDAELHRSGRGIVAANPVPEASAIEPAQFAHWLASVESGRARAGAQGRGETPMLLEGLRHASGGQTLEANLALLEANVHLACEIARAMSD